MTIWMAAKAFNKRLEDAGDQAQVYTWLTLVTSAAFAGLLAYAAVSYLIGHLALGWK